MATIAGKSTIKTPYVVMKRVVASTIAEFVIAITIIAICFTIASQVFMQASRSTIQFKEVKEQTEFQSLMIDALIHDTLPAVSDWKGDLGTMEISATRKDSVIFSEINLISNQKTTWQQTFVSEQ
jgi:type II secretory pathway pseudopilin PulG